MTEGQKEIWLEQVWALRVVVRELVTVAQRQQCVFARAHCEAVIEALDRFEQRVLVERVNPLGISEGQWAVLSKPFVKPAPSPDSGVGVSLSVNQ